MTVDVATLAIRIDSLEARNAARDMDRMRDAGGRAEQQATALETATRKLAGALALLGLGAGVGAIIRMADEYTKYTAQIKLATQSQREYAQAVDEVRRIANTAQQDLAATGTLYARIANGTRELGVQQKQVAAITETVNLALKVSGATAAESASAQLQLSQAFASGTLRGEEFNAVNEAAPRLMKALADGMGVPIGALRNMASEGQITSKIMAEVLPKALQQLQEEAKQVQTIGGAFTVLKNNLMEFVGVQAQASGFVSVLVTGIEALARNLTLLSGVTGTLIAVNVVNWLAAWLTKTYERITAAYAQVAAENAVRAATIAAAEADLARAGAAGAVAAATKAAIIVAREEAAARLAQAHANILAANAAIEAATAAGAQSFALRTLRLATAELAAAEAARAAMIAELAVLGQQQARVSLQIAAATEAQTVAQNALNAANGAGAASVGLASRAMGLLGGPIGAVVALLGLAATAWMVWSSRAKESNEAVAESFDEAHARIIKGLDEQISKNEKLIQLQKLGVPKDKAEKDLPILDQLKQASALLNDINNGAGDYAPGKGKSNTDALLDRVKVLKQIGELTEKMQKRDSTGDAAAAFGTAAQALASVRERLTGVNKQYLDDLKALQAAREANAIPEKEYIALVSKLAEETWKASDAGKDLAATSKAQIDARLEGIKSGIEREKNMRAEGVDAVAELQRQGLASDFQVYTARHDAAIKAGEDSAKVLDAEIAALAAYNGKDAAERIANDAKIKQLGAQRNEALRASLAGAEQIRVAYEYDRDKPAREAEAANAKELVGINDQIAAIERQIASYNKLPSAISASTIAQLEEQKVALSGFENNKQAIADIDAKIAGYTRLAGVQKVSEGMDTSTDVAKAKELLDILVAVDNAAKSAAQGMAASFGTVGTAISGLTTALTDYAVQQQAVAAQLAAVKADPKSSADKIAKAEMAASKASAQAQIKSYGDMAAASKGFFKENSKGYKLMETTERAFRAYEMAMALESMVKKVFFKEGEVAANVALNATKLTGEAATTAASTGLAATEASAWGITAVVKAMASLPFPLNLAAGAATLAAVIAIGAKMFGGTGGGGMSVTQQRQESQGTGTVFGDSTAKSDSIARSLELVSSNSSIELSYTQGMLNSLRAIESSLGGLGNLLVRSTGITSATSNIDVGGSGGLVGKIVSGIFGGKTSVQDTGFTLDRTTLGAAATGDINSYSYADMKKSGGWFSSGKSWTDKNELGASADAQFAKVLAGLGAGVSEAAKLLGVGGDAFTQRLNSFVIDIGKISLKDLSGAEIQEQLEAVFSKLGDDMAQFGVAGLEQFQQVGEGYFETLTRIATDYANLNSILASSGVAFGQTGMASIAARERLIALAGGIDELASMQTSFNDNFLTEAERLAPVQKYVTDQLSAMGLQSLDTRDKFKDYVLGLASGGKLATEAGAAQYTALLALADAFAKTHAATEDLTKSEQEIADERKDLLQQLDEITKSEAQLLAIQRAGIADVNKALFDQVQAAKAVVSAKDALATAYDKEAAAAKTAIEKSKSWVTTLNGLNANLALGNQSTLTPEQKYAEARAQFEKTLAAANSGDTTAQSGLSAAEQAFLTASQVVNASDAKYAADYARVVAANQDAIKWASAQVDLQQASYDALEAQVKGLITINDSVLTVAQAIANLQSVMGVASGLGVKFDGSHASGLANVPFDGYAAELHQGEVVVDAQAAAAMRRYFGGAPSQGGGNTDALVAEIKILREEVAGLRADQAAQTGAVVRATVDSNARAAGTVVAGVEKSAKASAWSSTVKGEYA
jgi:tape measure domain-containing protein